MGRWSGRDCIPTRSVGTRKRPGGLGAEATAVRRGVGRASGCTAPLEPAIHIRPRLAWPRLGSMLNAPFNMDGTPGHAQQS
jgi:hypothetical protein